MHKSNIIKLIKEYNEDISFQVLSVYEYILLRERGKHKYSKK